jgi:cob(I)alamin adenosyltransferase
MSERGDKGMTSGECCLNVSKDSPFVEAVGAIDDFQARLGLARVLLEGDDKNNILEIEKDLTEVMGTLYQGKKWEESEKRVKEIDGGIEKYKGRVENLSSFLVPGENEIEARLNLCRTGCRTAERKVVTLKLDREEKKGLDFDENILKYFNKLSTYLYWMWRLKL